MFKFDCFVDDKHVPKVLRAVMGLVRDPNMRPVANVVVKHGDKLGEAGHPTTAVELVHEQMKRSLKDRQTSFTVRDLQSLAETYGVSRTALGYGLKQTRKANLIKLRRRGVYNITVPKGGK